MNMDLKNQSVLITGSSSGIGRGISDAFLKENTLTILTGRDKKTLKNTTLKLSNLYGKDKVFSFLGDLSIPDKVQSLYDYIGETLGHLNHLVCNIGSGRSVPPLEEDMIEFQRMLDINILNAVGIVNKFSSLLEKSVSKEGCYPSITFVGSICGVEALGCPVAYATAKSALISYAKNISLHLGRKGIRVNVVSPGNIMFPGSTWEKKIAEDPERVDAMLKNDVPLRCFGRIEDISNTIVFLASKHAKFVNGANWVIDGGQTHS
jgi:3-oxoacyl-[acyl-carrier protein] reductase